MLNESLGIIENASEHGYQIDQMLEFVHWIMLALFVGWSSFFVYTLFRFHKSRHPKADYLGVKSHTSTHLEFVVVLIEAVLLLGFGIPIWAKRVNGVKPTDNVSHIKVVAQQFLWNFRYAGADGLFGKSKTGLITGANPLGLDPSDPAGKDDVISSNELHLPVNKSVILDISSKDVIHSFSFQAMRIGQDAIPGLSSPVWFKPIRTGTYELICGQLCGNGHYAMRAVVIVDTPEAFADWQKEQAQLSASSTAAPAK